MFKKGSIIRALLLRAHTVIITFVVFVFFNYPIICSTSGHEEFDILRAASCDLLMETYKNKKSHYSPNKKCFFCPKQSRYGLDLLNHTLKVHAQWVQLIVERDWVQKRLKQCKSYSLKDDEVVIYQCPLPACARFFATQKGVIAHQALGCK